MLGRHAMSAFTETMKQAAGRFAAKDYPAARDLYATACRQEPESPQAWCNFGGAAFLCADLPAAEAAYARALQLDDSLIEAILGMARVAVSRKDWNAAEERLARPLPAVHDKAMAEWDYLKGIMQEQTGDLGAAEASFRAAHARCHAPATRALHRLLLRTDQPAALAEVVCHGPDGNHAAQPHPALLSTIIEHLPSARSRWVFFQACRAMLPDTEVVFEVAAGGFLHRGEYAYAARVKAAAEEAMDVHARDAWPSLKEITWY